MKAEEFKLFERRVKRYIDLTKKLNSIDEIIQKIDRIEAYKRDAVFIIQGVDIYNHLSSILDYTSSIIFLKKILTSELMIMKVNIEKELNDL